MNDDEFKVNIMRENNIINKKKVNIKINMDNRFNSIRFNTFQHDAISNRTIRYDYDYDNVTAPTLPPHSPPPLAR